MKVQEKDKDAIHPMPKKDDSWNVNLSGPTQNKLRVLKKNPIEIPTLPDISLKLCVLYNDMCLI